MRKVPYFAGVALVGGSIVVALNWGVQPPVETSYATPAPSPWSVDAETVHLFSAFGTAADAPRTARPNQPSGLSPDVKLPPKKPTKAELSVKTSVKSAKEAPKRPPVPLNASGHIL